MKLNFAAYLFASGMLSMIVSNIPAPSSDTISQAYAFKDVTVSGLLFAAVVFLYRELRAERARRDAAASDMKAFVESQAKAVAEASKSQSEALGQVAQALGQLEEASRAQITIYTQHIDKIVEAASQSINKDT